MALVRDPPERERVRLVYVAPSAPEPEQVVVVRTPLRRRLSPPIVLLAAWLVGMPFVVSVPLGFINVAILIAATIWWSARGRRLRQRRSDLP